MENNAVQSSPNPQGPKKFRLGCIHIAAIAGGAVLLTLIACFIWYRIYFHASDLTPVKLNQKEETVLALKLNTLENSAVSGALPAQDAPPEGNQDAPAELPRAQAFDPNAPAAYSEEGASRDIFLTERELNALITKNDPELAKKFAFDLSQNLLSVKIILPIEEDIPIAGGKTLRLNAGLNLSYENGQPNIALKGISVSGIPVPNAWLGNLKNKNLVQEFGGQESGFGKLISDGIADIKVQEGQIRIRLKE